MGVAQCVTPIFVDDYFLLFMLIGGIVVFLYHDLYRNMNSYKVKLISTNSDVLNFRK